jgi:alpha-mannosidase
MAQDVQTGALDAITRHLGAGAEAAVWIVNPTCFVQHGLAWWGGALGSDQSLRRDGAPVASQLSGEGTWIYAGPLAPYSVTRFAVVQGAAPAPDTGLVVTPTLLENRFLRVELNAAGDIVRLFDKAQQREILPPGSIANQFQAFEDRPMQWGAWDVDIFYDDKLWHSDPASSVTVVEGGPLRGTLEIRRRILHSDYVQRISLAHHQAQLDFSTEIDWRERHILLKVAFPVDILAAAATYEIQWGHVQRPTHRNTSWDWARFETCAQKWVDLSEGGYGVSLLNDCKYGHDIRDNVLRLSLLRGPISPDPEADLGQHRFAYSLLPHAGGWEGSTAAAAYALNDPLIAHGTPAAEAPAATASAVSSLPFIQCDQPNIIIETIKRAEDGQGLIVRLYESQRRRGPVTVTTSFALSGAWRTNLIEEDQEQLLPDGQRVTLYVRPHQIVTLRLVAAGM